MYLLGQLCGVGGTIATILQPQFRKRVHILLCCMVVNALNGLNFLFIGSGDSAFYLCLVAVVQAAVAIVHEKRNTPVSTVETILFFLLYVGCGLWGMISAEGFMWGLTAENLLQLLPILGAVMLMLSVFAKTEQQTRAFLFLNGACWAVYTAIVGAMVFFSSLAAMISAGSALWKYRKK